MAMGITPPNVGDYFGGLVWRDWRQLWLAARKRAINALVAGSTCVLTRNLPQCISHLVSQSPAQLDAVLGQRVDIPQYAQNKHFVFHSAQSPGWHWASAFTQQERVRAASGITLCGARHLRFLSEMPC